MNDMRKKNNMRRGGGGGQRRYNNHGGNRGNSGGGGGNDSGNIQRQKHHATQMREKYSNMARDAQNNGDRVDVEYYLQHVDHYTRILHDITTIENERFAQQRESQQHQQAQQPQQQNDGGDNQQGGQGGDNNGGGSQAAAEEVVQSSHQPRMTRQRRPYVDHNATPSSDNGAKAANANGDDIPLPDGILPAI